MQKESSRSVGQLHGDNRLRLSPATFPLRAREFTKHTSEFELEFFEGVLSRDPCHEEALRALGYIYTARREYDKGLEMDQRLTRLRPDDATAFYNFACSHALLGDVRAGLDTLETAFALGFDNVSEMDEDPDLESLRADPRYRELRQKMLLLQFSRGGESPV